MLYFASNVNVSGWQCSHMTVYEIVFKTSQITCYLLTVCTFQLNTMMNVYVSGSVTEKP